jgi:hypothetical protein
MGSSKTPPAPEAPDYAAANREAITTDISTLPTRRLIEQAASLGIKVDYVDPKSGKTKTADFSGLGDAAAAKQIADMLGDTNSEIQRQQLELRKEIGVENARQTAAEVAASDPEAYAIRQSLTGKIGRNLDAGSPEQKGYQGLYDIATKIANGDPSTNALNFGLQQALADYQRGGKLDPATERALQDNVRSGQAARGNYLGDAAAVQEAATMGQAAEARRAQALQQLLGVQNQAFSQNQAQNQLALNAASTAGNEQRSARNETFGREQQKLSDASAIVLGQPITNQFGALSGAQNGAVANNPVQGGYSNLNPNAGQQGADWAQSNYSNAMNQWSTQANIAAQGNPWMGLLGSVLGGTAGALVSKV